MNSSFGNMRPASWQKLGLSVLCVILALVLILMIFATAYVHQLIDKISINNNTGDHLGGTLSPSQMSELLSTWETVSSDYTGETVHPTEVTQDTLGTDIPDNPNVVNILLVGQDRRPGEGRQRSDSMILCSFNTKTGAFSMTSFLRDTYVHIPDHKSNKINAAYAWGGMKLLTQTLATNFGVHVDGCVEVDFGGFQTVVDMLGGVDIKLTQAEVDHLQVAHGYYNFTAGMNHLNGEQALAYSRIRKIDSDSRRAERQRKVLTALINAYKNQSVSSMLSLAYDILDTGVIKTNMESDDIRSYLSQILPMLAGTDIKSYQIPISGTWEDVKVLGDIVDVKVIEDMDKNRELLDKIAG